MSRAGGGRCRALAVLASLALPTGAAAGRGEDEADLCRILAAFDARPAVPPLLDVFEAMAFGTQGCVEPDGCTIEELSRLEGPVQVVPTLRTAIEGPARERLEEAIRGALVYGSRFVEAGTGPPVSVSQEMDSGAPHRLFLILRDRPDLEAAAEAGDAAAVGDDFPVTAAFALGLERGLDCFLEPGFHADGRRADVAVYVAADQPVEAVSECVLAELFDATGVGGVPPGSASLFEDPWGRPAHGGPHGPGYSARDAALPRLLHHPEVEPSDPRAEVMATLRRWRDARCPAG